MIGECIKSTDLGVLHMGTVDTRALFSTISSGISCFPYADRSIPDVGILG